MNQTWALLVDGYRELASRKLFWFALGISLLIVLAFAAIGIDDKGWSILWWHFDHEFVNAKAIEPAKFYRGMFENFGVPVWLAWGATILGIVSTGSIFPDLIASGSIDLILAKPISRTRLFLVKYATGLFFSGLQVAVFTAACFLTFGLRGGVWIPSIFWAVPIMVLYFSFLYCVCALLGLLTRSALTSIIFTMIFWIILFLLNFADGFVINMRVQNDINRERTAVRFEKQETAALSTWKKANPEAAREPTADELDKSNPFLVESRRRRKELESSSSMLLMFERSVGAAKAILPKTTETFEVLKRQIGPSLSERRDTEAQAEEGEFSIFSQMNDRDRRDFERRREEVMAKRTTFWVLSTSIAFEVVVLGIAGWIFRRRDF